MREGEKVNEDSSSKRVRSASHVKVAERLGLGATRERKPRLLSGGTST